MKRFFNFEDVYCSGGDPPDANPGGGSMTTIALLLQLAAESDLRSRFWTN